MKKAILSLFASVISCLMTVNVFAAASLKVENEKINSDNITVEVVLSELPTGLSDISTLSIEYAYSKDLLTYVSASSDLLGGQGFVAGDGKVGWFNTEISANTSGKITAEKLSEAEGVLFELHFTKVTDATGKAAISITVADFTDEKVKPAEKGSFTISNRVIDLGGDSTDDKDDTDQGTTPDTGDKDDTDQDGTTPDTGDKDDTDQGTTTPDTDDKDDSSDDDTSSGTSSPSKPDKDDDKGNSGSNRPGNSGSVSGGLVTPPIVTPPAATSKVITDIAKDNWAYESAIYLVNKGVISGDGTGDAISLRPQDAITREEAAKIVLLAMGLTPDSTPVLNFADEGKVSDWARGYISSAVKNGIISGYTDNTIRAKNTITREEMVTMLIKALGKGTSDDEITFADASKITWSKPYMAQAIKLGVIGGYEDNTIRPAANISRAEAFAVLYRCMNLK